MDERASDDAPDPRLADLQEMLGDSDEVDELLDTSWSPPERQPRAGHEHETFDERLAEEQPDVWAQEDEGDGIGDAEDGEPYDDEVGLRRSGRLVAVDEGVHSTHDVFARDVGIDGGAACAEEAAMHIVGDEEY